jgi:TonB family protein
MSRLPRLIAALFLLLVSQISWAAPADSPEPRVILNMGKAKGLVYSPTPEYPKEALKKHWGGLGIFEVQFRRDGLPSAVFVTLSTGHKELDESVTSTLRQWRSWKGYRGIVMMVPVTFAPGEVKNPVAKKE